MKFFTGLIVAFAAVAVQAQTTLPCTDGSSTTPTQVE